MNAAGPERRPIAALLAVALAVVAFLVVIALAARPHPSHAFTTEHAPIAWLSSTLLAVAATLALAITLTRTRSAAWWLFAGLLIEMSLDERFQFHERLKDSLGARGIWGDAPMAIYPVAALVLAWFLRRDVGREARRFAGGGFAVGVSSVCLDLFAPANRWQATEEVLEVLAETGLVLGLILVLGARGDSRSD